MYFKDSMAQILNILHTFEKPAFVNMAAFFFREGVWRHGIIDSRRNVKERDTHVSLKSCIIQPIRWRLRHYWRVFKKVCHMPQTFSQRSVGGMSEAETKSQSCSDNTLYLIQLSSETHRKSKVLTSTCQYIFIYIYFFYLYDHLEIYVYCTV